MTPEDAKLLETLLEEQERLHARMASLDERIADLKQNLARPAAAPGVPPAVIGNGPVKEPVPPAAMAKLEPPPLPPAEPVAPPTPRAVLSAAPPLPTPPIPLASPAPPPDPESPPVREPWEFQLGTVWFARIGIVVLITGLVFLGNYAWQHVVAQLSAGGKLALLFLAGALLAGLGRWLERRAESTRNYGRVLIAGGAATIYYSTYAAHFVRQLRVIESPLLGGALLLALAGVFIAWADHRRSQMVAILTVVLAYYTSAINPIGGFTLFSTLLLTGGAVWLLLRHGWETLGWASLAGTYGSFAYWRFVQAAPQAHWSVGLAFVAGYWVLFTVAVLFRSAAQMPEQRRSAFLTLNNAAFFGLAGWRFLVPATGQFWWFALGLGVVLVALSQAARRRLSEQVQVEKAYLVQGVLLVTVGVIAKFTGAQLALLLAAESALLLGAAQWRHASIFQSFSLLSGAAAFLAAGADGRSSTRAGTGAILLFNAWWLRAQLPQLRDRALDARAMLFVAGGLGLIALALHRTLPPIDRPLAWAALALLGTASVYLLRVPELAYGAQAILAVEVLRHVTGDQSPAWREALPVIIGSLALSHWWQRQKVLPAMQVELQRALQSGWAVAVSVVGILCLRGRVVGDDWMMATAGAAVGMLAYGILTRSWAIAAAGQIFAALSVWSFLLRIFAEEPAWYATLAPIAMLAITSSVIGRFSRLLPKGEAAEQAPLFAAAYRIGAFVLLAFWLWEFVPAASLPLCGAVVGALLLVGSRYLPSAGLAGIGAAYLVLALLIYLLRDWRAAAWPDLLAILLAPLTVRLVARLNPSLPFPLSEAFRRGLQVLAVVALWFWTTRWTLAHGGSRGFTVAWSVLALLVFAAGLGLRERLYRLAGFLFLALAVGRVFLVDVWRLETLHRILSFLVLGIVLLVLGFIYNRFAEQIRRFL